MFSSYKNPSIDSKGIFKKLEAEAQTSLSTVTSSVKLHLDGISFGRWSLRLSNIPRNLSNSSARVLTAIGIPALVESVGPPVNAYFQINGTDYKVQIYNFLDRETNITTAIKNGACDATSSAMAFFYEQVKSLNGASLWRDVYDNPQPEAENCIETFIQSRLNAYDADVNHEMKVFYGSFFGAFGGVMAIAAVGIYTAYRIRVAKVRMANDNSYQLDIEPLVEKNSLTQPMRNSIFAGIFNIFSKKTGSLQSIQESQETQVLRHN